LYAESSICFLIIIISDQPTFKVSDLKDFLQQLSQNNLETRGPLLGLLELSKVISIKFFYMLHCYCQFFYLRILNNNFYYEAYYIGFSEYQCIYL